MVRKVDSENKMKRKKVVLFGVGKQGKVALYDLVKSNIVSQITAVDINPGAQEYVKSVRSDKVQFVVADAEKDEAKVSELMRSADLVIELLPIWLALPMARLAVKNGVNFVDSNYLVDPDEKDLSKIQAMKDEVRRLDSEAKEKGITVLPAFGMDPGIMQVLDGQAVRELDEVYELYSYGSGYPEPEAAEKSPIKYKFTWATTDIMRSYNRLSNIIRDGKVVEIPATEMFAPEYIRTLDVEGVGRLECFPNADSVALFEFLGIKDTIKNGGIYVCRWPGHCEFWRKMVKLHFLDCTPIKVRETTVVPIEFVASLLESQSQMQYGKDERDIAHLRADARGIKDGKKTRIIYDVLDRRDLSTGFTAMTRTVGFSISIGTQMILRGDIKKRGVLVPEKDVPFDIFASELEKRGIKVTRSISSW